LAAWPKTRSRLIKAFRDGAGAGAEHETLLTPRSTHKPAQAIHADEQERLRNHRAGSADRQLENGTLAVLGECGKESVLPGRQQ